MPKVIGDVAVVINPDSTGFRQLADAQLKRQLAGFRPTIALGADAREVNAAIAGIQARIKALGSRLTDLRIGADGKAAEATITRLQARLIGLTKQIADITMGADTKKLDAALKAEQAKLKTLKQQMSDLQLDADAAKAASKIASLQAEAFHLDKALSKMTVQVDVKKAEARLRAIDAELRVLKSNAEAVRIGADNKALLAAITVSKIRVNDLKREAADIRLGKNIDVGKLLAAESGLLGIEAAMEKLAPAAVAGDVALGVLGKAITGTGTGWGFLTRSVTLFGGAFNRILPVVAASVAIWHVLADAIIEIGAVWIPATIAVGAFAFAASDAAVEVQRRMQAMHTELDATGRSIPGLTSGMEKLHKAVRPQVFQLFGDAITIMKARTGEFATIAKSTGTVIDQLAARITFAITSNKSFSKFARQAVTDVAKLGDSIGNVFGIFGNFFKVIPGFATGLLTIGDNFTKILEKASAAAEPIIKWTLLLHGYILYTGLAVTASLALIGGIANLAKQFVTFAAGSVLNGINAIKSFGLVIARIGTSLLVYATNIAIAGGASGKFAAALAPLAANPLLWVTAAAIALGALVFAIVRSKDAAQQFNDTMQQTIQNASLSTVVSTIQNAQAATTARLAQTTTQLNQAVKTNTVVNAGRAGGLNSNGAAISRLATASDEYRSALTGLSAQQQLVTGRFGGLTKQFGSQTAALGILNAAGITTAQITDTNSQHWAQALIQVNSTVAAYQVMGTQAGTLGNDLDVLGRTLTDQYKAVQTLNQGWSAFISDVTGTQGSFDTVAQGFSTLADHAGTLRLRLGHLSVSYKDNKAAIDSLSPAGLALNQAFSDQVVNVDKLFASWRTAGLAGNLFTQGVKAAIGPLLKYANGSQEATAQLVALAQEAGYQGPISMQALSKWLGNTHGATQKLKDITNQATVQEALLTGAMQAQGSFIANKLIADINNAILKYNGVEKAAAAYGNAVARSGAQSDAAQGARKRLINDIIRSGTAANDTTGQIAAMISKVLGIPPKEALQIVMTGTGSFSLSQINAKTGKQQQAATGGYLNTAGRLMRAAGGYIAMGSGPVADDVPIMASKGEYVVRASSVARYGKSTMDAINAGAYAGGGLIERGNLGVLSGQYAVDKHNQFKSAMTAAEVSSMRSALKSAEAAAQAALIGTGIGGMGDSGARTHSAAVAQAYAASLLSMYGWGQDQMGPLIRLWNQESGWNAYAVNPASGAYGIPQSLGHGHPYNLGDYKNQIVWGLNYIRGRYGSPAAAWAHEVANNWYAGGGLIGMAAGGLVGKYATGGQIPLGKYLPQLTRAQGQEYKDYLGLRTAYLGDLAHARKGSWTSGHKAGIRSELGTLAKVQSAEEAAYDNILHHGTARANLSKFGTRVKAVARTSRDRDLSHSHPGFSHGLQYWLGVLTHLSQASVAPVYGGSQAKLQFPAWLGKAKSAQSQEVYDYRGLENSFQAGLSHARKGTWLYANRKALGERLYAVAVKQNAEAAAYADLVKHSTGSVADLGGLAGRIGKLGAAAGAEAGALQPALLGHLPGGHPGWVKALQAQLRALTSLSAALPFNPPWNPGNLGPSHTVAGGVLRFARGGMVPVRSYDSGGYLRPGLNLAWNGTGRPEPVGGGSGEIHIHLHNQGVIGSRAELDTWLINSVNRLARTGYLTQAVNQARN